MVSSIPDGRYSHLAMSDHVQVGQYRRPSRRITEKFVREDHAAHATSLENQLSVAIANAQAQLALRANLAGAEPGIYLQVESIPGTTLERLELKRQNIRLAAIHAKEGGGEKAALFLPDRSRDELQNRISDYKKSKGANKPNATHQRFEPLERIALATISSFWTSPTPIPEEKAWFEVWCLKGMAPHFRDVAERLESHRSNEKLTFPDYEVMFLHVTAQEMFALLVNSSGAIYQIRAGMDHPQLFAREAPKAQHDWVQNIASRLVAPPATAPFVTILDTGATRSHPLIEPFLNTDDQRSYDDAWGTDDHDQHGHGTNMAGITLYGDLTFSAGDQSEINIPHRLETVKILPPTGANPPNSYGIVTQTAVSKVELENPERFRAICCATTSAAQLSASPSSWSAAVDQICSGTMKGDEGDSALEKPKRLVLFATGNIVDHAGDQTIDDLKQNPIEDPAQAWNVVTVGGFTNRTIIDDPSYASFVALASAGTRSPFSRTSSAWDQWPAPIKPECVFEAGNVAINRSNLECVEGLESLCVLTTGKDIDQHPLVEFNMTSAAVGQASRMAATIASIDGSLWPETVRALIVHSAEWTPAMSQALKTSTRMGDRVALTREFGYGVPSLDRALSSAKNDVAIVAQSEIQPFRRKVKKRQGKIISSSVITNQLHYYKLPWPKSVLAEIYDKTVRLKVTLSYFVEPNPGAAGSKYPRTYQSFGLRFDLQRKNETETAFRSRINDLEELDEEESTTAETSADTGWFLGPNSRSAGSLHCDVWEGSAADLSTRENIAVYPIAGWWKTRTREKRYDDRARYTLIMSLDARQTNVDIYTPLAVQLTPLIEVEA